MGVRGRTTNRKDFFAASLMKQGKYSLRSKVNDTKKVIFILNWSQIKLMTHGTRTHKEREVAKQKDRHTE